MSAYDDNDKLGIEDDMDFYEDPNNKKKDTRTPGGGYSGGKCHTVTFIRADIRVVAVLVYCCVFSVLLFLMVCLNQLTTFNSTLQFFCLSTQIYDSYFIFKISTVCFHCQNQCKLYIT